MSNVIMDVCTVRRAFENIHRLRKEGGKGANTASLLALGEATRAGRAGYTRFVRANWQREMLVAQLASPECPLTKFEYEGMLQSLALNEAATDVVVVEKSTQQTIYAELVAQFSDAEYFFLCEEVINAYGKTRIDHEDLTLVAAGVAAHRENGEPVVIVTDDKGLVEAYRVLGEHLPFLAIVSPENYLAGVHLRVLEVA